MKKVEATYWRTWTSWF